MTALVLVILWWSGFSSGTSFDTSLVAQVGRFAITSKDLLDSYEFGPAFVKLGPKPLRRQLEFMIYERLVALEAERLGYDTSSFVRERVSALEEDLAVDELYRKDILSKVTLSPQEIDKGIEKAKVNLRMRWIYAESEAEARRFSASLKQGASFDSLYQDALKTLDGAADRSHETTWLKMERDNPEFAQALVGMRSQTVSDPIKGADGYYLVWIDEIWRNPISTQSEYHILRDQAVTIQRMVKADAIAREYAHEKMKTTNPVIKAEGFNIVRAHIAEKGLSKQKRITWAIPETFMTEAGPRPLSASPKFLNRPLVTFGNQTLTVRDYVRWYDIRQFQFKTHSLAAFNSSLKRTIWKMVQDKILSRDAYSRGLHLRDTVQHETRKWDAKLLYLAGRSHILRSIPLSDEALARYYQQHKHWYRGEKGKLQTFEEAKLEVRWDYLREEETKALHRSLQRLKKEFPVTVNEEIVADLEGSIRSEGAPINVIFYKPGGTFPRVAFPTIDEAWIHFQ